MAAQRPHLLCILMALPLFYSNRGQASLLVRTIEAAQLILDRISDSFASSLCAQVTLRPAMLEHWRLLNFLRQHVPEVGYRLRRRVLRSIFDLIHNLLLRLREGLSDLALLFFLFLLTACELQSKRLKALFSQELDRIGQADLILIPCWLSAEI